MFSTPLTRAAALSSGFLLTLACLTSPALAQAQPDAQHQDLARATLDKAVTFLKSKQDPATGAWALQTDGKPQLPAISALVVKGLILDPTVGPHDPAVTRAVQWIMTYRQKDGGIYDQDTLPNYNTAIAISALARLDDPEIKQAVADAQKFLRTIQWDGQTDPAGVVIDKAHPFFGGAGYGGHQRPDNSNLAMLLEGMHESGLKGDDPVFQKALVFLQRTQMLDSVNDMPYADGSRQGGFIYSIGPNAASAGQGQSYAAQPMIDETLDDGSTISRLACYGSMTYAGFKSYLYADLAHDDPRVQAAYRWIRANYTLDENPAVGMQGYYYYLHTMSRALSAWGAPTLTTLVPDEAGKDLTEGAQRNWANDLIAKLSALQKEDGSFVNSADRWMEGDPVLVTAYAVLALQYATAHE